MAKQNRISFTDQQPGQFSTQQQTPTTGITGQPGQFQWTPNLTFQAMANAPANATPAKQITTGQEQKQDVMNSPAGNAFTQATRNQLMQNLSPEIKNAGNNGFTPTFQRDSYGYQYQPKVYNQDAIDNYNKGLQQARDWDAKSSLSPGFKERIYRILNGDQPEQQLQAYVPNAAMQYQTSNPNDGSVMQNPNTNSELNMQWDVDRLRQLHPDWDEDAIQQYMLQPFNWQTAQALTNSGAWVPNQ